MNTVLQLVTPILALAGTLVVALLGFYQWRKQNWNPNRAANAAAQRAAYEELWQKLEKINLLLRKGGNQNPNLHAQIREVNKFFIARSLYFDDRVQNMVVEYVTALNTLREKVYASDDSDVTAIWDSTLIRFPPTQDAEIASASKRVDELRGKLKKKIQCVTSIT
jgi:hypothetical protein